ncbi:MAG: carboxymuconolactone decarboxylase family protein, partial [Alphaproteobacteria bacterium]|nr:carboxymuconolactone decarboxylase family protein [Alphaproteobacteria bacterium]
MSRLSELDAAELDAEQRQVLEAMQAGPRGGAPGPLAIWLQSPGLCGPAQQLGAFIRFGSSLPPRLYEIAVLVVAAHWRTQFEWWAHARLARKGGVALATIEAIKGGEAPPDLAADEQMVYDVAIALVHNRRLGEPLYQRAVELLGTKALIELVGTMGYYTLVSMTLNAFEVELPEGEEPP